MAIKAQALAGFIAEFTHDDATDPEVKTLKEQNKGDDLARWKLFVDGSSNYHGYGAGLVLQTPLGEQMEYVILIWLKPPTMRLNMRLSSLD